MFRNFREKVVIYCSKSMDICYFQKASYVDVRMRWKKDPYYDTFTFLAKPRELRPLCSLKNIIIKEPDQCIPISAISKRDRELEISDRVASFLRRYPAIFEEFTGPQHNLPWFRLTKQVIAVDQQERDIYLRRRPELVGRLRRLILMSKDKVLPLRVIQGMLWYLGLPEDFLRSPDLLSDGLFRMVEMGDEEQGLSAEADSREIILSSLQKTAMNQGRTCPVSFPLFPSKGLRLKKKIEIWLDDFQKLPYISPYEDFSFVDPNSDVSEKRVAGVLHELLSLFVDNSAERRRILCLRKYLGLPQKFDKAFERHPHVFYLLLKSKTCFVVLKEAYNRFPASAIEEHPLLEVRKKYVNLMDASKAILRSRRSNKPSVKS